MFQGFEQAKFAYGDSILGLSQFIILPLLPLKLTLNFKEDKIHDTLFRNIFGCKNTFMFFNSLLYYMRRGRLNIITKAMLNRSDYSEPNRLEQTKPNRIKIQFSPTKIYFHCFYKQNGDSYNRFNLP